MSSLDVKATLGKTIFCVITAYACRSSETVITSHLDPVFETRHGYGTFPTIEGVHH